jgi:hypothetical protein
MPATPCIPDADKDWMYSEERHACHDNSSKGTILQTIFTASPSAKASSALRAIYATARDHAVPCGIGHSAWYPSWILLQCNTLRSLKHVWFTDSTWSWFIHYVFSQFHGRIQRLSAGLQRTSLCKINPRCFVQYLVNMLLEISHSELRALFESLHKRHKQSCRKLFWNDGHSVRPAHRFQTSRLQFLSQQINVMTSLRQLSQYELVTKHLFHKIVKQNITMLLVVV